MVEGPARKSKYPMIEMDLANQLVLEQARALFPLGSIKLSVSGSFHCQ